MRRASKRCTRSKRNSEKQNVLFDTGVPGLSTIQLRIGPGSPASVCIVSLSTLQLRIRPGSPAGIRYRRVLESGFKATCHLYQKERDSTECIEFSWQGSFLWGKANQVLEGQCPRWYPQAGYDPRWFADTKRSGGSSVSPPALINESQTGDEREFSGTEVPVESTCVLYLDCLKVVSLPSSNLMFDCQNKIVFSHRTIGMQNVCHLAIWFSWYHQFFWVL